MKYKILIFILALLVTIFLIYPILIFYNTEKIKEINEHEHRDNINTLALPIIEDDSKYIELQTKKWIDDRENNRPFFGALEKDKVIMSKWIENFKINGPEIFYYDYHDNFNYDKFKEILMKNQDKRLVIKITHLQSNYGIILTEPLLKLKEDKEIYMQKIYSKCQKLFKSCFVCNHDRSDPPTRSEIKDRKKESYYKLYETIKPGILIQDFFYSQPNRVEKPTELKILVFADKIIKTGIGESGLIVTDLKRYQLLFDKAREISSLLGSSLIRVDFFIKEEENPYQPYINEISLSPNGGMRKNYFLFNYVTDEYKDEVKNYKIGKYDFVDNLLKDIPRRKLPIEYYLTDNDNQSLSEKFKF